MLAIEKLLGDIRRAALEAGAEGGKTASFLSSPARLLSVVAGGETRRTRNQRKLGIPIPRFCLLSVTWRCNLKCVGCYARNYRPAEELSLDEIARVIREACDLGCFLFVIVGGEPLMVDGLIETLSSERRGIFFLFTNGTRLRPKHAGAVDAAGNILPVVSVEGDRRLTDARRGEGVGKKVFAAMRTLHDADVAFGFSSMVTHKNVETVTSRKWFDDVWDAGARFGFLIDYVPMPYGLDESLILTPEDRQRKATRLESRYAEARPLVLNFPPDEYASGSCQSAGRGFFHINADGFAEPCPFSHYASENVREKHLADILRCGFFGELRREFEGCANPEGHCMLFLHDDRVRQIAARTGAHCTEAVSARVQA